MIKIDKQIIGYSVIKDDGTSNDKVNHVSDAQHSILKRSEVLQGKTYKISTALSEHALYITINNERVGDRLVPFEIFINCKDMKHFQWIVALTRVISAVFRQGGNVNFILDELKSVYDPNGGYFSKGKYVPSLVAEIGGVIERHFIDCGFYVVDDSLRNAAVSMVKMNQPTQSSDDKVNGSLCDKCHEMSVVLLDGCATCLSCGSSKCG